MSPGPTVAAPPRLDRNALFVFAMTALACSGSSGSANGTAVDGGLPDVRDASPVDSLDPRDTGSISAAYGLPPSNLFAGCVDDDDCNDDGAICSVTDPTPVCVGVGGYCTPGTDCAKSGFCVGRDSGTCLARCEFTDSGFRMSCGGKNKCAPMQFRSSATETLGVGVCEGGCRSDADCTGGRRCQTEAGLCLPTLLVFTKTPGSACNADDLAPTPKCFCMYTAAEMAGYCANTCYVGETTCGAGFTCDAMLPKAKLRDTDPIFTKQPTGLAGRCMKNCATDSDCAGLNAYCDESAGTGQKTCHVGKRPCVTSDHCPSGQTCTGATTTALGTCG